MWQHPSIADIPEPELVKKLLESPRWKSSLFEIKGLPASYVPDERVPLTALTGQDQGDVDILLRIPRQPECATAIEIKRIKARSNKLNKLQEFKKAVTQANGLAALGFWQVYLYIFVVVDSREANAGRVTYDGLPADLQALVTKAISLKELNPIVGLIHHQFVQPMDHEPLGTGTFSGHLLRLATPQQQPTQLTEWMSHRYPAED